MSQCSGFLTCTSIFYMNKSAQRALDRSPKKKVKGHSGAIYRRPLMLYTKYQGSSRFLQECKCKIVTPGA